MTLREQALATLNTFLNKGSAIKLYLPWIFLILSSLKMVSMICTHNLVNDRHLYHCNHACQHVCYSYENVHIMSVTPPTTPTPSQVTQKDTSINQYYKIVYIILTWMSITGPTHNMGYHYSLMSVMISYTSKYSPSIHAHCYITHNIDITIQPYIAFHMVLFSCY